jgi:stage V sporulation protein K
MHRRRRKKRKLSPLEDIITYVKKIKRYKPLASKLKQLNNMIGMAEVKTAVVEQMMFLISNDGKTDGHFLNTVITGSPGCGKTSLAKILFEIWSTLDVFQKDDKMEFKVITRSDLIGSYMGHTATKTRKLLQKHSGGVIFIDEAYSLVSGERDDYGKECLDELTSFMSEQQDRTIIIIAGYENDLEEHFFQKNAGLRRRFNWTFNIKKYSHSDLYSIFKKQLHEHSWKLSNDCSEVFKDKYEMFVHSGGDTNNIAFKCKLQYSKRTWKKKNCDKIITKDDVEKAIEKHFKDVNNDDNYVNNMYI